MSPSAVVTGASSGIGEATALRLAKEGFDVVIGARRADVLRDVAGRCGGRAVALDVTDSDSVSALADAIDSVDVLVNNAGLALGRDRIEDLPEERVRTVFETNVLGLLNVTRALLPKLRASGAGHVVNIGSIAGSEVYPGGAGYTASKHAVRAITRTLRMELLGEPVRVTLISPGLVETEFSLVRFGQDKQRAANVYRGIQALTPDDVADSVAWVVTRPPHVNVDEIVLLPRAQATSLMMHREEP